MVVGISTGGWASLALAARNPANVAAIVNFAGGRGGYAGGRPNAVCGERRLIEAAGTFGRTSRVPGLWLYSKNDSYFSPALASAMSSAWEAAGGQAELHILASYRNEGHDIANDQAMRTEIFDAIQGVMERYDFLVSPTLACTAVPNGTDGDTMGPEEINGQKVERLIGWCMTYFANFTGHPAASVPAGLARNGLPVGMQILGRRHADADVLAASAAFERLQLRRPECVPDDALRIACAARVGLEVRWIAFLRRERCRGRKQPLELRLQSCIRRLSLDDDDGGDSGGERGRGCSHGRDSLHPSLHHSALLVDASSKLRAGPRPTCTIARHEHTSRGGFTGSGHPP